MPSYNSTQRPFDEQLKSLERKAENKFIKKAQDYVEYVWNDCRYFISYSLRIGDQIVEGQLYKKANSKLIKLVKSNSLKYQMRNVILDFNTQNVTFKAMPSSSKLITNPNYAPKGFAFGKISHINKAEISLDEKACNFKYKFLIHT